MADYLRETPAYKKASELVHAHTLHRQLSGSNNLYQWDNGLDGDEYITVTAWIHQDGSGSVTAYRGKGEDHVTLHNETFGPAPEAVRRYELFRLSLAYHGDYIEANRKASSSRKRENRDKYQRAANAFLRESQRLMTESGVR